MRGSMPPAVSTNHVELEIGDPHSSSASQLDLQFDLAEPGFDDFLEKTLERISDIESLGRTREITLKDLWKGGKYKLSVAGKNSAIEKVIEMETLEGKDDEDEN